MPSHHPLSHLALMLQLTACAGQPPPPTTPTSQATNPDGHGPDAGEPDVQQPVDEPSTEGPPAEGPPEPEAKPSTEPLSVVPRVRQAKASVEGSLDADIVRRIVRAHVNEIRACYAQALRENPKANGRIAVRFTIGASGEVTAAEREATMPQGETLESIADCAAAATETWRFPHPSGGGTVEVISPYVLDPTPVGEE